MPDSAPARTAEDDEELPEQAVAAVEAAAERIHDRGGATKKELVRVLIREYPLGCVPDGALGKIEAGERYRARGGVACSPPAWWRSTASKSRANIETKNAQ